MLTVNSRAPTLLFVAPTPNSITSASSDSSSRDSGSPREIVLTISLYQRPWCRSSYLCYEPVVDAECFNISFSASFGGGLCGRSSTADV